MSWNAIKNDSRQKHYSPDVNLSYKLVKYKENIDTYLIVNVMYFMSIKRETINYYEYYSRQVW